MTTRYKLAEALDAATIEALDGVDVTIEVNAGKSLTLVPKDRKHRPIRLLEAIKPRVRAKDNGQPAPTAQPAAAVVSTPAHGEDT